MSETLTLLVIDDNEDDRMLCRRALKDSFDGAMNFIEAGSGEKGLKSIEEHNPHCVMLDYSLPGRNGIEVLKRIRAQYPHLPVIMLTGQGNEAIAVQSMKEGAQDYIAKNTITPETLQRVVRLAIEHGTLQRRIYEQRTSLEIFTRALAHDLKEPVRTIRSFLDRMTDWQSLNETSQQSFQYIRKAADRMSALIDAVYFYTRLDGAEQMEKISCDISSVLVEVQENLAQLIQERGAAVRYGSLPTVHVNQVQMIQLFQNLVANAIRHCDKQVVVEVEAQEREEGWQIAVRDNGPGIAPEHLEKIFDPFKRLSQRREEGPGLGLGLAINRKIVESYGGKIWCESQPGSGAAFFFSLPKAAPAAKGNAPQATAAPEASDNKPAAKAAVGTVRNIGRIMLIDDNEADIELNRLMLVKDTKLQCDLLTAYDGKEALAKLAEAARQGNPVDLILLDINIPGMTGFELLTEMRKEQMSPNALVVMCTTSAYDMDKRMAESLGAADYLTKPPQFILLKDIIDRCERLKLCREGEGYILLRAA